MRIQFTNPIQVETETGSTSCAEAEVSVAVSNSVAIRIVPVDGAGNEHPDAATGIVGTPDQPDISAFMESVSSAVEVLMAARGL